MKILLIHNIATSYYKNIVFNDFFKQYANFKVIHLAETEKIRDWKIDLSDIEYPYEILVKGSINDYGKIYFAKEIWKKLDHERPDIIYLGGYFHIAYWVALLWAKTHGIKALLEMDSNKFDHVRVGWKEFIKKLFVRNCDVGLTYGELSKAYFLELGMPAERIVIKPNVSSSFLFYPEAEKKIDFPFKEAFIYVGRFSEEKNLVRLIEAYKNAKKTDSDNQWGLILVGSGPQENELQEKIKSENIPNVVFPGFVDKHHLRNFYNSSKVFVLPSLREPWGLVVNEAMMCSLPVIVSTQCGCSSDLVNENGYTFNPLNVQELQKILVRYINNEVDITKQQQKSIEIIQKYTPVIAATCIQNATYKVQELAR